MHVAIVEPFYTGSHAAWAEGYAAASQHDVTILELSGAHWKWRMHGGAITLARAFDALERPADIIVASDMLDLTVFLALTRKRTAGIPVALYFHENQITYPWSPKDRDHKRQWDRHYGFINFSSALAADGVFFNSQYHHDAFLSALPDFLKQFPDHPETCQVDTIKAKSHVLELGFDFAALDAVRGGNVAARSTEVARTHSGDDAPAQPAARPGDHAPARPDNARPLLLWNHRWEYDKNPEDFFAAIAALNERGVDFELAVLGEVFDVVPDVFTEARQRFADRIVHFGYAASRADYAHWLWRADVLPVTSHHDFFGASVVEAVACGTRPLLPRRLAYPELIPEALHDGCFYNDFDDLVDRLEGAITAAPTFDPTPLADAVRRFDWREMAPKYDAEFEALAASK